MTLKIRLCLKICLFSWIVICAVTESVYSQANSDSEGTVVSEEYKSPIPNVSIEVRELTGEDSSVLYRTQSSASGHFTLNSIEDYPVELVFVHPNYMRNTVALDSLPEPQFKVDMAYAHSIQIGGRVDDGITGNSVPSALIEIVSENENVDPVQKIGTSTNRDGEFRFSFSHLLYLFQAETRSLIFFRAKDLIASNACKVLSICSFSWPAVGIRRMSTIPRGTTG